MLFNILLISISGYIIQEKGITKTLHHISEIEMGIEIPSFRVTPIPQAPLFAHQQRHPCADFLAGCLHHDLPESSLKMWIHGGCENQKTFTFGISPSFVFTATPGICFFSSTWDAYPHAPRCHQCCRPGDWSFSDPVSKRTMWATSFLIISGWFLTCLHTCLYHPFHDVSIDLLLGDAFWFIPNSVFNVFDIPQVKCKSESYNMKV